jgi:hypothetical protein
MSDCGEYLSFGDRPSWKARSARGFNGRNRRPPSQKEEAQQSEDSQGYHRERDAPNHCVLRRIGFGLAEAATPLGAKAESL